MPIDRTGVLRRPRLFLALTLVAAAGTVSCARAAAPAVPRAIGGVMDLRSWDFGRRGSVHLDGEWDFYPGRLLYGEEAREAPYPESRAVPDLWRGSEAGGSSGRGSGTYRLRLLLPASLADPAIGYTTVSTAFELEANGVLEASAGRPAERAERARSAYLPGVARLERPGEARTEIDLVIRVSNYEYRVGGPWRPIAAGSARALEQAALTRRSLAYMEFSALVAFAICYLFFFLFRRTHKSFLYFALLLGFVALRTLVTAEYPITRMVPSIGFGTIIRLEYLTVFLPPPIVVLFFSSLFPDEAPGKAVAAIVAPFLALTLLAPLAPLRVLTSSVLALYLLLGGASIATAAFILVPAVARGRKDAVAELSGGILLLAFAVNEMLYSSFVVRTGNYFPYALLAFVLLQCYVLARRFSAAIDEAEALTAEKDMLLREVQHRVKNSLQIVSSSLALQAHRASSPEAAAALEDARSRIRAIGLVHEKLYAREAAGVLDLGAYLRDLSRQLESTYLGEGRGALSVEAEPIAAPRELCIDFGLALAELLSNTYRHAGAGREAASGLPRARVELRREGRRALLRVEDDGAGFPPGFDPARSAGMGLKVVSSLVAKRGGVLTLGDGCGAAVEIRIPLPEEA